MMDAIINTAPGKLELHQLPIPTPDTGEVLIRTIACGICSTDMEMIAGWDRTGFPTIPGHEWCGTVEKLGNGVEATLKGRTVVGDNILTDGGEVGFEYPGGYARHFITRAENLVILPDTVNPALSTLIEPLAVCLRGFNKVKEVLPTDVLIFGDGPIGLLQLMLARHAQAETITVVGGREARLSLAKSLGADAIIDYRDTGVLSDNIKKASGIDYWPLIFESSGNAEALTTAIDLGNIDTRILLLGDYAQQHADLKWNRLLHGELHIIGSNTGSGAWAEAGRLSEELPLASLVTHHYPAEDFETAMQIMQDRKSGAIKVVLEWE